MIPKTARSQDSNHSMVYDINQLMKHHFRSKLYKILEIHKKAYKAKKKSLDFEHQGMFLLNEARERYKDHIILCHKYNYAL